MAILASGGLSVNAQSPPPDPSTLADQSLDQLLNTPVVSVSKREQRLSKVPAAVYVISRDAIHRSGATTIPEVLRLAPGVQVARITATQWAISIRGFNGLWSNKLLVMIDGRTIYSEIFSGVDWEMQNVILDDIDRIEVVRGPGSSIWGANAMNGVINIVTKQASETSGTPLKASTGNLDRLRASARFGGAFGETSFRVYGTITDQSLPLYAREIYPDTHRDATAGFRIDSHLNLRDMLTFQGDGYVGKTQDWETQPLTSPVFRSIIANTNGHPASFDLQAKWTRTLSDTSQISLQVFGTHTQRIEDRMDARENTFDVELQHSFTVGPRNSILWGLESRTVQNRVLGTPAFYFTPDTRTDHLIAGFISDDITLVRDRLQLSVGTKLEKFNFTGLEHEPSARLAWTPGDSQTLWASVGRAVRVPSIHEQDIRLNGAEDPGPLPLLLQITGNPKLAPETLLAYEVGHRMKLGDKISFDTAAYWNHYGTLVSSKLLPPYLVLVPSPLLILPVQYDELKKGSAVGVEETANWDISSHFRLASSYRFIRTGKSIAICSFMQPHTTSIIFRRNGCPPTPLRIYGWVGVR